MTNSEMFKKYGWNLEEDIASFQVDENHRFTIEPLSDGFMLRFFDLRGIDTDPKPLQLYRAKLSFGQLGY